MAGTRRSTARARVAVVPFPGRGVGRARALSWLPSGRSLATGFGLVALAAVAYAGARTTSVFALTELEVHGATPAIARDVRAAVAPLRGESLVALDGDALLSRLEGIPAVRAARYDRAFPHTLVVYVTRERPLAILRRGTESWLLSARGRVLGKVSRGDHPRLPRVWVRRSVAVAAGAVLGERDVRHAVTALRPVGDAALPVRVRTVRTGAGDLTLELASGLELRLGDHAQLALKLAVAAEILRDLAPAGRGGPGYLDVSVPERPVAGTLESKVEVEG